ncbi:MAG: dienelactone hydrolase family protein [Algoriphagus sp.]|uniref:alpha/beta hydrolase n=1 Tax=Algoriphagus sp. TaxID=1872435 RepID=UPI00273069D7|nr:dienelactone hydrolase family protein [Algoriphagus sp.]MDP2040674.1 dienelactone hydrolase family protein [Algoriphagus sp.]MDP3472980.1 dienelactone hydrolase family protein [Algoriphagus sp.]
MPDITRVGLPLHEAKRAIILIHGRGATAESMLSLVPHLNLTDYAILAPQANGNSWYPFGFMATDEGNKVALDNSLGILKETWSEVEAAGILAENTVFLGFSQGACLSLEFSARNGQKFGAVIAFTGGLIGEQLKPENYSGDFQGTPIFIGSSDRDFHVPAKRIKESADLLRKMGADVTIELFDDPDHRIREEEINWVNQNIFI